MSSLAGCSNQQEWVIISPIINRIQSTETMIAESYQIKVGFFIYLLLTGYKLGKITDCTFCCS